MTSLQKILISIFIVSFVIIFSFFIFKKSPKITNYPSKGETIVAFGDSLVEGVGATKGNDFPSVLSRISGKSIINMGVSGNTTAQGLARIDEVIAQKPKVVLVLLGGNDFLRKVPLKETFKNIDDIVVKIQDSGAVVVLLGIKGGLLSDEYASYFKEISQKRGTLYVSNVLSGLFGHNEYMSDGIHPNDVGYRKMVDRIYPVFKKAF